MDGELTRDTADRISVKDAASFAQSANLSREVYDSFQPLQERANTDQPAFLDLSLHGLYPRDPYTGIDATAARMAPVSANTERTGSGSPQVFDKPANQALEPMPPISDSIKRAPDASPVVLNLQITNVPEVSQGVNPQEWLQHVDGTFAAGAQAVRPTGRWMSTQNAVTDSLVSIGPALDNAVNYYANTSADQVASDIQAVLNNVGDLLDRTLSYPHTPEERAKTAGSVIPFAFADGIGTEGQSATLKTADAIATHVDNSVMQAIEQSMKTIDAVAETAPDVAQQTKQMLYEYLKGKGLTGPELEYAGIPRGYFDGIEPPTRIGDNCFAMSKADEPTEGIPKRPELGAEKDALPERLLPSERFVVELKQAVESLSTNESNFLQDHGIEVKAVSRITDVPETTKKMAGCYRRTDSAIYVPEEIFSNGRWVKNDDVPFVVRHEFGHAFNEKRGKFGQFISNRRDFAETFMHDFKKVPPEMLDKLGLSENIKPLELARDEVFADMYAHASSLQSNNPYSKLLKQFFPSCLKYLEDMPKW